jgi:putative transposase
VIVAYIDAHRDRLGVEPICRVLTDAGTQIAPSTYYAAKSRPPSARSVSDATTTALIERVHADNYGVYGARKVHAELRRQGHPVARCTVQRLLRQAGLRGISRAKGPRTTVSGSGPDTRPDLVDRGFRASAPDRLWVADITYCRTFAGWVYAAFVIDVVSRRVVGWQLSTSLRTDLALDALEMGLWTRQREDRDPQGLIHHSDKGVQGGLNRSSQHLEQEVAVDGAQAAGSGSGEASGDVLAGAAVAGEAGRAGVLARDRAGREERGRGGCGGRVGAGRVALVPTRWRDAADQLGRAVRPLPVAR